MSEIGGETLKVTRGWASSQISLNGGEPHSNKSDSYRTMSPERKRSIKRQGKNEFRGENECQAPISGDKSRLNHMNRVDAWLILSRPTETVRSLLFGRRIGFECLDDSHLGHFKILLQVISQHCPDHGPPHQFLF
jgi:hypothetical protein